MGGIDIPKTRRFRFKLPRKLYQKKLYKIEKETMELQPLTKDMEGKIWRDPVLTNYGCACFHFILDEEKLLEHYRSYVSEDLKEKIEGKLEEVFSIENALYLTLEEDGYKELLDRISRDHPDVISHGLIQIVLTTIPLKIEYDSYPVENTLKSLNRNLELMTKIAELHEELDVELDYGNVDFEDEIEVQERLTIHINIDFDSNETLEEVEKRIDDIISPLKNYLARKARTDLLLYP